MQLRFIVAALAMVVATAAQAAIGPSQNNGWQAATSCRTAAGQQEGVPSEPACQTDDLFADIAVRHVAQRDRPVDSERLSALQVAAPAQTPEPEYLCALVAVLSLASLIMLVRRLD